MNETERNFNWAYIEGDLDVVFGYGSIPWEALGFTIPGIRWAVQNQYQVTNAEGMMISLFPIENEELFRQRLGAIFNAGNPRYRIVTQEECDSIHAALVAYQKGQQEKQELAASDEEIYQAEMLLLMTEIANNTSGEVK